MMPNSGPAPQAPIGPRLPLSRAGQAALRAAAQLARNRGDGEIAPVHLVAALLAAPADEQGRPPAAASPPRMGSAVAGVIRAAAAAAERAGALQIGGDELLTAALRAAAPPARGPASVITGAWPDDDSGTTDHALRVLAGRTPVLLLLTGDTGTLPSRVLQAMARRLASGAVPAVLRDAHVLHVQAGSPLSSLGHRTRAQLRTLEDAPAAVAILDDVVGIVTAPGGLDALRAALAAGVRLVAAGDEQDLAALHDVAALRRWVRSIPVSATTERATLAILQSQAGAISAHHGVTVTDAAAEAAVQLSGRLGGDVSQPGAALDLLEHACAAASVRGASDVGILDVATAAGGGAVLPGGILAARAGDVGDLQARLQERIIGQDHAVRSVADAILRAETGVRDPDRPLGSFLFLGPTGVGKTELARTLATALFGDAASLLRLDMGEYQEPHSVARLVGAPPGYVGYGHGGHLTEPLRRRPYSVVLLDEIEKAHADVLNVLLGVLDEGRLTDGFGNLVDARNAVLIMTSNLGGGHNDTSLTAEGLEARIRDAVTAHFPPEFVGRVDDVVVFQRLSEADLTAVAGLQIDRFVRRMAARHFDVAVADGVRAWLAAQVIDSPYGARPLRAVVRRHVEDVVARAVLAGRLEPGGRLALDVRDGSVVEVAPEW